MPKYKTEVFGQVIYAPEISYDELLDLENEVKLFITEILESFSAEFMTFESEGDRTFFQCVFQDCDEEKSEQVAGRFAGHLNKKLEYKLLFVDKMLVEHYFFALNHQGVKLQKIVPPEADS